MIDDGTEFEIADECPGDPDVGPGVINNLKDEYECQKKCQKCEKCQFFKFIPEGAAPSQCELDKFKTASWTLKGYYTSVNDIWGPRFCGKNT